VTCGVSSPLCARSCRRSSPSRVSLYSQRRRGSCLERAATAPRRRGRAAAARTGTRRRRPPLPVTAGPGPAGDAAARPPRLARSIGRCVVVSPGGRGATPAYRWLAVCRSVQGTCQTPAARHGAGPHGLDHRTNHKPPALSCRLARPTPTLTARSVDNSHATADHRGGAPCTGSSTTPPRSCLPPESTCAPSPVAWGMAAVVRPPYGYTPPSWPLLTAGQPRCSPSAIAHRVAIHSKATGRCSSPMACPAPSHRVERSQCAGHSEDSQGLPFVVGPRSPHPGPITGRGRPHFITSGKQAAGTIPARSGRTGP
jgi:hypothetical protein